ncbi:unnamed protein product [Enterobius vermicularis]|uniref:IU_nuc_hydro domain-containing protein n=1 Tax=Enterobius vermicularis TaxID=51028 RepID=A0A158QAA1_ENTVE|nr:unnamed protein product [Enterobius vermicularis]
MVKKLVIDTDGAIDDIRAISLALQTADVEVLAITTVHGVIGVDQVVANVSRCLRANQTTISIYKGAGEPLVGRVKKFNSEYLFGRDGNSDQGDKHPKVLPKDFTNYDAEKPAALALIDLLKIHDDVTLVCIGPLTNIALAIQLCENFVRLPKEMFIMGGNMFGVGNLGSNFTTEFNFGSDPEAASIVLKNMQCPITIIPWEAAFFEKDTLEEKEVDFHEHLHMGTSLSNYFDAITTKMQAARAKANRQYAYVDEIAVGSAIDAERIVKEFRELTVVVELNGKYTRGQIACDWTNPSVCDQEDDEEKGRKVKFVVSYNVKELNQMMIDAVKNCQ